MVTAQDPPRSDTTENGTQGLVLDSIGMAPQSHWNHGGLLVVRCRVTNASTNPVEGFLVGRVMGNLSHADRCRIALEPESSQSYEFQIRLPLPLPESKIDFEVSLYAIRDGNEVLVVSGNEPATKTLSFFRQEKTPVVTALAVGREPIPPLDWRWESAKLFAPLELAWASRIDGELSRNTIGLEARPLPLNAVDWKCIDTLIVADPKVLEDAAGVSMMRSFLFGGGRIWIMLDDIETKAIGGLLTENQQCETIDTVEIDRFVVDTSNQSVTLSERTVTLTEKVPFKKVVQRGGVVTHSIEAWPAAIVMPIGRGELFLTTLGSAGWIEPRLSQWSTDPYFQSDFQLRSWARGIADLVHSKRATPLIQLKDVSYPMERIGNPIVSRNVVAWILLLFCALLLAFGLWQIRLGELKWMGLVSPGLALAVSASLVAVAWLQKSDIPTMVSLFQWVQYENPVGGAVRESAVVYSNAMGPMELRGNSGGFVSPDPMIDNGVTTITTDDFQHWRMNNDAWPTGVWNYTSETTLPNASMIARGEFTPEGLVVQIPDGLPSQLKDPVLNYAVGTATLGKPLQDDRVLIDGEYSAEGERWTLDSLVDDEQSRRSVIYRKILGGGDRTQIPKRTFFGWTELFPIGPQWDAPIERRGVALVAMPVSLAAPVLGSQIRIPYALIEVRNANLGASSPVYMESVGRWVSQSSNNADNGLEFILPEEVAPLKVSSIEIDWDVQAPRRRVQLSCVSASEPTPIDIVTLQEPSLPWKQTITDPRILSDFEDGNLILKVQISEDRVEGSSTPWQIKHLRISAAGVTLPKNQLVKTSSP